MNGSVLIRWGASTPGREAKSIEVFGKAVAQFEQYTKEGRVRGHREYFAITGPQNGFMIADGEVDELMKILGEEEMIQLTTQAAAIVSDFEIETYAGGDDQTVERLTGNYADNMRQLGYM